MAISFVGSFQDPHLTLRNHVTVGGFASFAKDQRPGFVHNELGPRKLLKEFLRRDAGRGYIFFPGFFFDGHP
jgi:hypothetical protein